MFNSICLIINCCHFNDSDGKLLYIIVTAVLTVAGSFIITKYSNHLTNERNVDIVKSDIMASCHKLLRTLTGMQASKLGMKTSERLMNLTKDEIGKQFHKEQTFIFQNYYNNLSISFEEYRSELQKHIRLYLINCTKFDKEFIMDRKKIIDESPSLKDFEDYNLLTNEQEIKSKEILDKNENPQIVNESSIGKALNEIMNHLSKEVV